eukprot:197929-Hanusia_phi.AAC.1
MKSLWETNPNQKFSTFLSGRIMAKCSLVVEGVLGPSTHPPAIFMADKPSSLMLKHVELRPAHAASRDSSEDEVSSVKGFENDLQFGSYVWVRLPCERMRPIVARLMKRLKAQTSTDLTNIVSSKCWMSECAARHLPGGEVPAKIVLYPQGCSKENVAVATKISVSLAFEASKHLRMDVECNLNPACVVPVVRSALTGKVSLASVACSAFWIASDVDSQVWSESMFVRSSIGGQDFICVIDAIEFQPDAQVCSSKPESPSFD